VGAPVDLWLLHLPSTSGSANSTPHCCASQ
jgi:hypothetical protein